MRQYKTHFRGKPLLKATKRQLNEAKWNYCTDPIRVCQWNVWKKVGVNLQNSSFAHACALRPNSRHFHAVSVSDILLSVYPLISQRHKGTRGM